MDKIKSNKPVSIILITIIYIAASALGIWVYLNLPFALWASLLLADAAATVFVFIFSVIFRNASVYDPYWSVQPIVITICFAVSSGITSATVLLLISVICWGARLTYNWAYVFDGLGSQDWRYTLSCRHCSRRRRIFPDKAAS